MASKSPRKMVAAIGQGTRLSDRLQPDLEVLFERRLPAGAFVSQSQLAEMTDVPIAPLRDALRIPESEGVLTIYPRTGIQFTKPGLELTRSTYQFRSIIETAAVAQFAESASDAEIAELEKRHLQAIERIERNGLSPDEIIGLEELETALHGSIVACLNNPLIEKQLSPHPQLHLAGPARPASDAARGAALAQGAHRGHRSLPAPKPGRCRRGAEDVFCRRPSAQPRAVTGR